MRWFLENKAPGRSSGERGFISVELMACLAIILQLLLLGSNYMRRNTELQEEQTVAEQICTFKKSAVYYFQDHFSEVCERLGGESSENLNEIVTPEDLKNEGYLPPTFPLTNLYGQTYRILVGLASYGPEVSGEEQKKQIKLLILTQGDHLKEGTARTVARYIGGEGGYISTSQEGALCSAYHDWSFSLPGSKSEYTGQFGTLSYIFQHEVLDSSTFLRRVKIDGQPQLNCMETNLGIAEGNIVQFVPGGEECEPDKNNKETTTLAKGSLQVGPYCLLDEQGLTIRSEDGASKVTIDCEGITITKNSSAEPTTQTTSLKSLALKLDASSRTGDDRVAVYLEGGITPERLGLHLNVEDGALRSSAALELSGLYLKDFSPTSSSSTANILKQGETGTAIELGKITLRGNGGNFFVDCDHEGSRYTHPARAKMQLSNKSNERIFLVQASNGGCPGGTEDRGTDCLLFADISNIWEDQNKHSDWKFFGLGLNSDYLYDRGYIDAIEVVERYVALNRPDNRGPYHWSIENGTWSSKDHKEKFEFTYPDSPYLLWQSAKAENIYKATQTLLMSARSALEFETDVETAHHHWWADGKET